MKKILKKLGVNPSKSDDKSTSKVQGSQVKAKPYSKIHPKSKFDGTQKATALSQKYLDAEELLKDRTYAEKVEVPLIFCEGTAITYPILSVIFAIVAGYFIADFVSSGTGFGYWSTFIFTMFGITVFATVIELVKAYISNEIFLFGRNLGIYLFITMCFSIALSSGGAYIASFKIADKTEEITAQNTTLQDSVKTQYADQIAILKAQIDKDKEVLSKYKAGDYRNHYASERLAKNTPLLTELLKAQKSDLSELDSQKTEMLTSDHSENYKKSGVAGVIILFLEVLYIVCIWQKFAMNRKIKTENRNHNFVEMEQDIEVESPQNLTLESLAVQMLLQSLQNGENIALKAINSDFQGNPTAENTPQKTPKVGFQFKQNDDTFKRGRNNDKTTLNEVVKTQSAFGEGECAECGQMFQRKTWNHKFCSDECRITNWEKRTGAKVKKGKKGIAKSLILPLIFSVASLFSSCAENEKRPSPINSFDHFTVSNLEELLEDRKRSNHLFGKGHQLDTVNSIWFNLSYEQKKELLEIVKIRTAIDVFSETDLCSTDNVANIAEKFHKLEIAFVVKYNLCDDDTMNCLYVPDLSFFKGGAK